MTTDIRYFTKEEALQAITEDGHELKYCTPELKNDEDVTMTAIKKWSWSFQYASDKLKSDKPFIMKALNEGVYPWYLICHSKFNIQSDLEVMTLAVEKSDNGFESKYTKGEASLNKELAAKALIKWGSRWGIDNFDLWKSIHPTLQDFFTQDSFYEKAQAYLIQLEQERQAELVSGGSTAEDEVVW